METTTLRVDGMSCGHCVNAVAGAVSALRGVSSVDVDLSAGIVTVVYDAAQTTQKAIISAIEEQGYDAAE